MPRKRYLTLEETIQRLFEDSADGDEQSDVDIVVVPPENAEASDEEEGNDKLTCQAKNGSDFMACEAYMRRFIGIGCLRDIILYHRKKYWSLDKDISVPIVRDSMSHIQYRNMKQNLHLTDNSQMNNSDKLYKVRSYLNLLNRKFHLFGERVKLFLQIRRHL
ncbi:hypothetical protein AVEN_215304-1 [Araneus ventricosus]|uniref:PiggyBac transposable element-derived protein domain-containing protein n=1 Tax=Araneus ventricosus TaxID=182803 RepID=A0A4Y2PZ42_ARAVE|nr:hypothetical protein AVEN_215304-1 [Araneus ventricosus]